MKTPQFANKREEIAFIVENKTKIIAQKKAIIKTADGIPFTYKTINRSEVKKEVSDEEREVFALKVIVAINTTNLLDSHKDVHIPGIWNKTIKENKNPMHVQEHIVSFKTMISDGADLIARVEEISWKELGYDYIGSTQALIFESTVRAKRNKFMFDQYANGWVKSHSVGMYYVKLFLCVNDPEYKEEYANWNTYSPMVANIEDAIENGYFWAVTEAKYVEGSAVVRGSNPATPTLEVEEQKNEPLQDTQKEIEPPEGTLKYKFLIDNFNLELK